MYSRSLVKALVAGISAALWLPHAASASPTQTYTFLDYGNGQKGQTTKVSYDGGAHFTDLFAGRYLGKYDSGPQFNVFCSDAAHGIGWGQSYITLLNPGRVIDPAQPLNVSTGYYEGGAPGGMDSAMTALDYKPANLGASPFGTIEARANAVSYLAETYLGAVLDDSHAAAVQLAIWDIVQDGGNGLAAGLFRSSFSNASLVNTYLTNAASAVASGKAYWIQAPRDANDNHYQDFITLQAVPEPAFYQMGALLALGGLALRRRSRA